MFRVDAPDAQKVRVRVGAGFDMTKEADGLWHVTTVPLVEGFHYYMISIDGAAASDPATETFFGGKCGAAPSRFRHRMLTSTATGTFPMAS